MSNALDIINQIGQIEPTVRGLPKRFKVTIKDKIYLDDDAVAVMKHPECDYCGNAEDTFYKLYLW